MLRRVSASAVSRAVCGLTTALASSVYPARASSQLRTAAQKTPTGDEDWMDFDDDDFWFLDEMFEGRLETPEFLPDGERKLLEREGLDGSHGPK